MKHYRPVPTFFPDEKTSIESIIYNSTIEILTYYPTDTDATNAIIDNTHVNENMIPDANHKWRAEEINFLLQYQESVKNENSYLDFNEDANDIDIALSMLTNNTKYKSNTSNKIPLFYYAARNIYSLTKTFLSGHIFSNSNIRKHLNKQAGINYNVELKKNHSFKYLQLKKFVFGIDNIEMGILINDDSQPSFSEQEAGITFFKNILTQPNIYYFRDIEYKRLTKTKDKYFNYAFTDKENGKFTLEEQRHLQHILSKEEKQIQEAISYYSTNPYLLKEREHQITFEQLILQPELLQLITQSKKTINQIARLIKSQYMIYKGIDYNISSFLLRINFLMKEIVSIKVPEKKSLFLNSRKEIINLISPLNSNINNKQTIKTRLFLTYLQTFSYNNTAWTVETLSWYIIANIYLNITSGQQKLTHLKHEKNEILGLNEKLLPSIKKQLIIYDNLPLHKTREYFTKEISNTSWKNQFPIYSSENHSINIFTFNFTIGSKSITTLPNDISNHPLFKKIIQWDQNIVEKSIGNTYILFDKYSNKYRITLNSDGLIIQTKINNQWGQLINKNEINDSRLANHDHFNAWLTQTEETIYITNKKNQPYIKINKTNNKSPNILTNPNNENIYLWQNQYIKGVTLDPDLSFIWGDNSDKIHKIDFPNLDVTFKLDEKNQLKLDKRNYHLNFNQTPIKLNKINYFTELKNSDSGGPSIIIPRYYLKKDNLFDHEFKLDRNLSDIKDRKNKNKYNYHIFDIKQNHIIPHKNGRFYLSYLHLLNRDYFQSLRIMKLFSSSLSELSDEQKEEIVWILSVNDSSPNALAIKVQAYAILKMNSLFFNYEISNIIETFNRKINDPEDEVFIEDIYEEWLSVNFNIGEYYNLNSISEEFAFSDIMSDNRKKEINTQKVNFEFKHSGNNEKNLFNLEQSIIKLLNGDFINDRNIKSHSSKIAQSFYSNFYSIYETALQFDKKSYKKEKEELITNLQNWLPDLQINRPADQLFIQFLEFIEDIIDPELGKLIKLIIYSDDKDGIPSSDMLKSIHDDEEKTGLKHRIRFFKRSLKSSYENIYLETTAQSEHEETKPSKSTTIEYTDTWVRPLWSKVKNPNFNSSYTPPKLKSKDKELLLDNPVLTEKEISNLFNTYTVKKFSEGDIEQLIRYEGLSVNEKYTKQYLIKITSLIKQESSSTHSSISKISALDSLLSKYLNQENSLKEQAKTLKERIYDMLNASPSEKNLETDALSRSIAEIDQKLQFSSLLQLYGRSDFEAIFNAMPYFNEYEINEILSSTKKLLLIETKAKHLNRIVKEGNAIIKKHSKSELTETEIINFIELLKLKREFNVNNNIDYLIHA